MTVQYDPAEMPERVFQVALGLYACGIDLEKTVLFVQSEVPGHAELTWYFNTLTPLGELPSLAEATEKNFLNCHGLNGR